MQNKRAKVGGQRNKGKEDKKVRGLEGKAWPRFHSTFDIVEAAEKGLLPDKIINKGIQAQR